MVEEVRGVPGFESFRRPLPAAELRDAAAHGPVVAVNVSQRRADALLVSPDDVASLPLNLTAEDVYETVRAYVESVEQHQECLAALENAMIVAQTAPTARHYQAYQKATSALVEAETAMESVLTSTLEWLWETIGLPVAEACGLQAPLPESKVWPRMWWCPTGLLTLLPLHAAGFHREPGRSLMDRAVVSYTPSLRALTESRRWKRSTAPRDMLHVALHTTPGLSDLPHVRRERDLLTALFGTGCTTLEGSMADRASVLRELPRHRCAHFSCHALSNSIRPAEGGLLLSDGLLSIGAIAADHQHREFAFLSACKTALGGLLAPDESMTLSAALHYTGYRHVIATLWSIHDSVAATVVEDVYREMYENGTLRCEHAAVALHRVVRRLRDMSPDNPSHWMPFTHTGP
ncbi:CHAT domain-containing protein [Streptomyces mirabilis]|uniref:CHAT domain-containing protein n=1 Tax=Streptomyces mirabilis TaxID=68239 RepID=UPI00324464BE